MRDVYIIGTHATPFRKWPDKSYKDLTRDAYLGALADTGWENGDQIEFAWFGNCGMWTDGQGSIRGQVCFTPLVRETAGPPRSFALGFSALPAELTDEAYAAAFDLTANYGDVVLLQRTPSWADFLPGGSLSAGLREATLRDRDAVEVRELKLFIALDPFDSSSRGKLANLRSAGVDPRPMSRIRCLQLSRMMLRGRFPLLPGGTSMSRSLYLIDGHAQIYRAYYAPYGGGLTGPSGEPTKAIHAFCSMLFNLIAQIKSERLREALLKRMPTRKVLRGAIVAAVLLVLAEFGVYEVSQPLQALISGGAYLPARYLTTQDPRIPPVLDD